MVIDRQRLSHGQLGYNKQGDQSEFCQRIFTRTMQRSVDERSPWASRIQTSDIPQMTMSDNGHQ